jgi:hypothetical protein
MVADRRGCGAFSRSLPGRPCVWADGTAKYGFVRMGLLDDAIREHLELKRLRGADPGLVAREEREAFGSDSAREPSVTEAAVPAEGTPEVDDWLIEEGEGPEQQQRAGEEASSTDQETMELDMSTILGAGELDHEAGEADPVGPVGDAGGEGAGAHMSDPEEKQLRFEQGP